MLYSYWIIFAALIFFLLFLDLSVFHKKNKEIKIKEALYWTIFWIVAALIFNVFIYYAYKHNLGQIGLGTFHIKNAKDATLSYFTGYIIEKSLSLDNLFVIAIIFEYFNVPAIYQHKILFWGIIGAIVMRGIMIFAGVVLIQKYVWITYVFGVMLIFAALKILFTKHDDFNPKNNIFFRIAKRILPITETLRGAKFFVKENKIIKATPLFIVLIIVESSDLLFAIDSIPAILSITSDPFIVFSSNIFAILGLRSLFFVLHAMMDKFKYLNISIVIILGYVGLKMILAHSYPIPTGISLAIIAFVLSIGIILSFLKIRKDE